MDREGELALLEELRSPLLGISAIAQASANEIADASVRRENLTTYFSNLR